MLKLKLQYFGHLMQRADSLECSWTFWDAGKDWGQKEKSASEDEMAGWHHQCDGHELGQTSGDGEGQRGLVCCMGSERVRHNWVTGQQQQWQTHSQHHTQGWKELLSCKITNRKRMPTLTTFIHHSIRSPRHSNQEKRGIPTGKEVKQLFSSDKLPRKS